MTPRGHDAYPAYALSERLADGAVHLLGLAAAILAICLFLTFHAEMLGAGLLTGLAVYWVGLIAMLSVSFCYHMTPWEQFRPSLRRADHATIFLKIAGTYTPFVISIGTVFGYVVLALVWVLALLGAITKLFRWRSPGKLNAALYLGLGWISVLIVWPIFATAPLAGWCAVTGGLLYSAGVVFYQWEGLKFANAIWHGFVVLASGFFFAAVWISALA